MSRKRRGTPALQILQPGDHFFGVPVRWKYGVEDFLDFAIVEDQCQALEQSHTFELEGRQA